MKRFILFFLFLSCIAGNGYASAEGEAISEESPIGCSHIVKSVSADGATVTCEGEMSFAIDWWYRSASQKWKEGDQIYVIYDFDYKTFKIVHALSLETAWGGMHRRPFLIPTLQSIVQEKDDRSLLPKIVLDNGYVFKGKAAQDLQKLAWKAMDHILILANGGGLYQLWNVEKSVVLLAEFVNDQSQTVEEPIEIQDLWGMEDRLNAQVLSQPEATQALVSSLFNYTAGLNDKQRPIGVFLFIGPTGVGKTELAKALAQEIYRDSSRLLRFDMSHFVEPHSLSRLIGSQPGYVNHEEGGQLTNPLRDNPQIVVLLDEIEKAHPQARKIFLPVFDEGFILDTKNNYIPCRDTLFIMTSNLCASEIAELHRMGYGTEEILRRIEPQLMEALSPELYNRVEPVLFQPFAPETMVRLVKLMLGRLIKNVSVEKGIQVHVDDSLVCFLEKKGYHPLLGARPLKKLIEKRVTTSLAYYLIREGAEKGDELVLFYEEATDSIVVSKKQR